MCTELSTRRVGRRWRALSEVFTPEPPKLPRQASSSRPTWTAPFTAEPLRPGVFTAEPPMLRRRVLFTRPTWTASFVAPGGPSAKWSRSTETCSDGSALFPAANHSLRPPQSGMWIHLSIYMSFYMSFYIYFYIYFYTNESVDCVTVCLFKFDTISFYILKIIVGVRFEWRVTLKYN